MRGVEKSTTSVGFSHGEPDDNPVRLVHNAVYQSENSDNKSLYMYDIDCTYHLSVGNHWAVGREENCPMCPEVASPTPHPCRRQTMPKTSPNVPQANHWTMQRPRQKKKIIINDFEKNNNKLHKKKKKQVQLFQLLFDNFYIMYWQIQIWYSLSA